MHRRVLERRSRVCVISSRVNGLLNMLWMIATTPAGLLLPSPPPNFRSSTNILDSPDVIIRERLGEGSQAEVLLGESASHGGRYAIKLGLKLGAIAREAAVLSVMQGRPGFPRVMHYEPSSGHGTVGAKGGVLVMELLGPSLDMLCQKMGHYTYLSAPTVMRVGREALSLLQQLHLAGFVHNDVKPGNFLVSKRSKRHAQAIHLIDFGLSTLVTDSSARSADALIGTPMFASLAAHYHRRAMRPVDDIESLVYMLSYLAAGDLPWQGQPDERAAVMKKELMTNGCGMLIEGIHSSRVTDALHTMWEEVVRCRGDGRKELCLKSIDYEACAQVLQGRDTREEGGGDVFKAPPFEWEDRARGAVPLDWGI